MAQPPFLIDQLQIEPGSAGTRLISRDTGTGGLKLTDPVAGALLLSQLAGLQTIPNVFVVGKSGAGAQYTTIQDALDDVPASASATNPYIILVLPGRYDQNLSIYRDGVRIVGLGQPEIRSTLEATPNAPGATHTISIATGSGTTPRTLIIEDCIISNAHTNKAVLRITGSAGSVLGDGGFILRNCSVRANAAAGNYSLWANTCNHIRLEGGSWQEAANLGLLLLREVALFQALGVTGLGSLDLRCDTAEDLPSGSLLGYFFSGCPDIARDTSLPNPVVLACSGGGKVQFLSCRVNDLAISGNRSLEGQGTVFGDVTLQDTTTATLSGCTRGSVALSDATAFLDEPRRMGDAVFGVDTSVAVTFEVPYTDDSYQVALEVSDRPANDETPWITAKTGAGFTINFQTAQTLTVTWLATRTDV